MTSIIVNSLIFICLFTSLPLTTYGSPIREERKHDRTARLAAIRQRLTDCAQETKNRSVRLKAEANAEKDRLQSERIARVTTIIEEIMNDENAVLLNRVKQKWISSGNSYFSIDLPQGTVIPITELDSELTVERYSSFRGIGELEPPLINLLNLQRRLVVTLKDGDKADFFADLVDLIAHVKFYIEQSKEKALQELLSRADNFYAIRNTVSRGERLDRPYGSAAFYDSNVANLYRSTEAENQYHRAVLAYQYFETAEKFLELIAKNN